MDRTTAKALSAATQAALESVAEEFGLVVDVRGGSYDSDGFKPRVTFKVADADKREWERWAEAYGFKPEDFGATFVSQGKTFTLCGLATRSPKRPILAKDAQGRVYKFTEQGARMALAGSRPRS